jgi:3-dehydroquinate synthase
MSEPTRIPVGGGQSYEVIVGTGILGELPRLAGPDARIVAVLHAVGQERLAAAAGAVLEQAGYRVSALPVPDGEAAKDISVAAGLWSALAKHEVGRRDVIVGVGGGAVTDLAGFTAATWLRGVRVILVPTTLLAMADAAIGGKTAVNIPAGKNLVGAFHPPAGVLADLSALATLPPAEYASGLAEVMWGRPGRAAVTSASWSSGPLR